jgi:membrane protease YdiL (CAAX protease family)
VAHSFPFRIQREADGGRQAHFTISFLLLILATLCTLLLRFVLPLFALGGISWATRPDLMIGGLVSALSLLMAYFYEELIHYSVLGKWAPNTHKRAIGFIVATFGAFVLGGAAWFMVRLAAQP